MPQISQIKTQPPEIQMLLIMIIKRLFSNINKPTIDVTNNAWNKITQVIKTTNGGGFIFSGLISI